MELFVSSPCKLCETRRAKRDCPGIGGEICTVCCGAERENSINSPLDCDYLRESRIHHRPPPLDEKSIPHLDVKLTDKFVQMHEPVIILLCMHLRLDMEKDGASDWDAREALASLVQTYRTLQSGLIYETRSPNPYAATLQENLKKALEELRQRLAEKLGMETLRDTDILGCLVFVQRLELQYNNGRPKSRAFLDFLRASLPLTPPSQEVSEPRIEL